MYDVHVRSNVFFILLLSFRGWGGEEILRQNFDLCGMHFKILTFPQLPQEALLGAEILKDSNILDSLG